MLKNDVGVLGGQRGTAGLETSARFHVALRQHQEWGDPRPHLRTKHHFKGVFSGQTS